MAFGISGLINNITDSVQNLVNSLTGNKSSSNLYPSDQSLVGNVLNPIQKANWNTLPFPYSFDVLNTVTGDFGDGNGGFSEFKLPLAPGKINQTEHFAISIKSTQGGTVVSHGGNKYKTLNISGTTGVAPFRGAGGVQKSTGEAIFQPDDLKYKSGYEVFLQLRNYFKAYYQFKNNNKGPGGADNLRLVFKNYKDGEFLIVELIDFQMDRTAPRSFLYDYNLSLKVIGQVSFATPNSTLSDFEKKLQQATELIDTARGVFLRSQDIIRQIESTFESTFLEPLRKASLAIKAFEGIGTTALDMGNQAMRNTLTAVNSLAILLKINNFKTAAVTGNPANIDIPSLDRIILPLDLKAAATLHPADSVIALGEGLSFLAPTDFPATTQAIHAQEKVDVLTLPRDFYETTLADLIRVKNNAEDFFNLGSPQYDQIFNRTSTVTADSEKVATDDEFDLLDAFNQAISGVQNILATDTLFKSTFNDRIKTVVNSFGGQIALQSLPAVQQIVLSKNVDLERLAQTYLGDANRWVEIAELNDLRAPYIVQDQSDTTSNVKHPGDTLLVPANPRNGFSKLPNGKEITSGPSLDELEKSLGTDLKLTPDFDLSLGNNGDLEIVRGADNVAQAVVVKLGLEKGELVQNPGIGVNIKVGRKFPNLSQVREDLVRSLTQDARIDRVENIQLQQDNDALTLMFDIKIKQVDVPVPVVIKV